MKRKHSEVIHAYADGQQVQLLCTNGEWKDVDNPGFLDDLEYRIKPAPKPDIVSYDYLRRSFANNEESVRKSAEGRPIVKITWDGETGRLKDCRVIGE